MTEKLLCPVSETWGRQNQGQDKRERKGENSEVKREV